MTEIHLSPQQFDDLLSSLRETDDVLYRLEPGEHPPADEVVDAFVFSGHVEAIRSAEIEEDLWDVLDDLELEAADEEQAWAVIKAWYAERGFLLLTVSEADERDTQDEYVISEELARRLMLL